MAYTSYPTDAATVLVKANKAAADALKANKNPLKSSGLKKAVEETGMAAKKKLDADIAGVRKNAIEHFTRADDFLGKAMGALKASKDAYAKWQATQADKDKDMACYGEGYIQTLHKLAKEDADAYGKSWFQYRAYNPGIDSKYCGDFNTAVGKLIAEQKGVGVKIDRMGTLAKEAGALRALVSSQKVEEALDVEDFRKSAAALKTEVAGMFAKMVEGNAAFTNPRKNAATLGNYAKDPKIATKIPLKNIESIQVTMMNHVKNYLNTVNSVKKVYATRVKAFPAEAAKDGTIKQAVTETQGLIVENEKEIKEIEKLFQQATKDVATIRGRYKK